MSAKDKIQKICEENDFTCEIKKSSEKQPVVGVGVLVIKDKKFALLGKRLSHPGYGDYEFPGGFLDHLESFEECARREVFEETGVKIKNIRFLRLISIKDYSPMHFVDVGLVAEWASGEPSDMETLAKGWRWYNMDNLPQPLFIKKLNLVEAYKNNISFMDI